MNYHLILALLLLTSKLFGEDLGFRFQRGQCINEQGQSGLNPKFVGQCGDFANADVRGLALSGVDLSGSVFKNANLRAMDLSMTELVRCDFSGADLTEANLSFCSAFNAIFEGAVIENASIHRCDFTLGQFSDARMNGVHVTESVFDEISASDLSLDQAVFERSSLVKANLRQSHFIKAEFEEVDFNLAKFDQINAPSAVFTNIFFRTGTFSNSDLRGTIFTKSIMDGLDLSGSNLQDSILASVFLGHAVINQTNFHGATHTIKSEFPFDQNEANDRGLKLFHGIDVGNDHSCSISAELEAKCWGAGGQGRLGNGSLMSFYQPTPVVGIKRPVKQLALGCRHSCALNVLGEVYCWGENSRSQLGIGRVSSHELLPHKVEFSGRFKAIDSACNQTCGVSLDDQLYCWGRGDQGALGTGLLTDQSSPQKVKLDQKVIDFTVGKYHTCASTSEDSYCWGFNGMGEIGDGTTEPYERPLPVPVVGLVEPFAQMIAGDQYTCGRLASGPLYCWGFYPSYDYELDSDIRFPVPMRGQDDLLFRTLRAGPDHICGISLVDETYCWGRGSSYKLAHPDNQSYQSPRKINFEGPAFEFLAAGDGHTCGSNEDGQSFCWGYGYQGQLGTGETNSSAVPLKVLE